MARKKPVSSPVDTVQILRDYLDRYEATHPGSRGSTYRRNWASIHARIIDPGFRGMDRVQRDDSVWETLSQLPEEVHQELTVLLLLTEEELSKSFANMDFDNSIPSTL